MIKFYLLSRRYLTVLFCLLTTAAWSQSRTITGTITSADDGSTMPGVNIVEMGTNNGTVSDAAGNYSIVAGPQSILLYSFVGYVSREVPVGTQTTINVSMEQDITSLSEVVVVGYGTVEKQDLTGAVTQISSENFNPGINPNPLQAIQGKVAGLNITQASGDPNQSPTVRLRGYTSLAGGSDPLYVVDGVIGVPINSISPSDIETIDVLKDASASAIYGSRAANGVIMITTKRGKSGRTVVNFNNYVGIETISKRLDVMNAEEYRAQVVRIKGDPSLDDNLKFPTDDSGNGYDTDWMNEITQTGFTNNHDLAISGGTPSLSYRGSLNYIKREGIVRNTGFDRITGRINLDQRAINDKLNIQYNLAITNTNSDLTQNDIINRAALYLPTIPVRNADGSYYEVDGSFDLYNPVAMLENYVNKDETRVLVGAVNMKYELFKGFSLGANGALRNQSTINSQAYNGVIRAYISNQGLASRDLIQTNDKLLELTAEYRKELGSASDFSVLGGYSYQDIVNDGFGANNNQFVEGTYELLKYNNLSSGRGTLLQGRTDYTSSFRNQTVLASFFGRVIVNVNDRYNLTATVRRDGSSKFGTNNKWGIFPSVAAGWTLSNEDFLSGNDTFSFLKLRVGWGRIGNSEGVDPYNSLLLYGTKGTYYDGSRGDFVTGYGVIQNANPDLKWEVLSQVNIGLDFELLSGRINGTVEVYDKTTDDMLYNYTVQADGSRYFTNTILANVGSMSNKGIEVTLGADVVTGEDFGWNTGVAFSAYKNTVISLSNDQFDAPIIRYNGFQGRGLGGITASQLREGHPLGEFYIPHFEGYDADGNILMTAEDGGDPTTDFSRAKLFESGISQPKVTAAFTNNFKFGNLDLGFQLRGVFGNKIINNLRSNLALPGSVLETNMLRELADFPANYSTPQLTDMWLESGAFVRLDNWQIGYNIPGTGVLNRARIYVGGNNLFIITNYKGIDPELEVKGDLSGQTPNSMGMDYSGVYPKTRSFLLGIDLTL